MLRSIAGFLFEKSCKLLFLLFAVCTVSFWLVEFSPIDPIQAYVGADMMRVSPEQREAIARHWGLNEPPDERFWQWLSAVVQGDLGTSMIHRRPVAEVIAERFLDSAALLFCAWVLSGVLGFVAGVVAAMKKDTWVDRCIKGYCYILASTPTFWVGLLFLMIFSVWLGWLPVGLSVPAGRLAEDVTWADRIRHMILPALTLGFTGISAVALHTRQKLIDILDSEYILFARAQGEKGSALFWRHGLRNVALPAITLQFTSFSELFGGAVLAEQVFSYPGLGQTAIDAGLRGDVPLLLGIVLFSAIFVFTGNALADLVYRLVDPRVREGVQDV
ncbi:ABC transporter permease [Bacillaceae bacterium]